MIYQISSGQRPAECELGVAKFLNYRADSDHGDLLQSVHGALPGELSPHSFGVNEKSTAHFCAMLFFLVEITGIEPVTSCMPCKRSPEPRTHAPPHKGARMNDIRR